MAKVYKKGAAYLLSAALVMTSVYLPGGGNEQLASAAEATDLTTGLVAYYPFDGSLDNVVSKDGGKAKLHGGAGTTWNTPAVGDATYGTGKKGKAFDFNGGGNSVEGNNGLELDAQVTTDAYTISFWAQMDKYTSASSLVFASAGEVGAFNLAENWFGDTFPTLRSWQDNPDDPDNPKWAVYVDAWEAPAVGTWTYITLTYTDGTLYLYRNGVEAAKKEDAANTLATIKNQILFLGINFWDATIDGRIDDFAIYSRALSATEVAALYAEENAEELTIKAADDKTTLTKSKNTDGTYNLDSVQLSVSQSFPYPMQLTWKLNEGAHATIDATGKVSLTDEATDGEKITVTATNSYEVTGTIELTVKVSEAEGDAASGSSVETASPTPSTSTTPTNPSTPSNPTTPSNPSTPSNPASSSPASSQAPTASQTPAASEAPSQSQEPAVSQAPVESQEPAASQAPAETQTPSDDNNNTPPADDNNNTGVDDNSTPAKEPEKQTNVTAQKQNGVTVKVDTKADGTAKISTVAKTDKTTITVGSKVTVNGVKYNVTVIDTNAFAKCKNVTTINLPSTVKTINKKAFTGAKKLKTVKITSTKAVTVKKGAFQGLKTKNITVKVTKKMSAKQFKKMKKNLKNAGFKGKIKRV